ncbi:MAG: hypothetical protein ACTSXA_02260 [Candidatus Heimdallarchaeota archaeon]
MAINQYVWHAMFIGIINTVLALSFVIVLIVNYARKKTIGTALLLTVFVMVFINALSNPLIYYFEATFTNSTIGSAFVMVFLVSNMLTNIFLYNFANRHIFVDGPVVQNIINALMFTIPTIVISIMSYEIATGVENGLFVQTFIQSATGLELTFPTLAAGLILFLPMFVGFQLRLMLHIGYILIKEKDADPIKRVALFFVLISVIFMTLFAVIAFFFIIPTNGQRAIQLLHAFAGIFMLIMLTFGYFGWVLPNWLKRSLQKRYGIVDGEVEIFSET